MNTYIKTHIPNHLLTHRITSKKHTHSWSKVPVLFAGNVPGPIGQLFLGHPASRTKPKDFAAQEVPRNKTQTSPETMNPSENFPITRSVFFQVRMEGNPYQTRWKEDLLAS